MAISEERQKVCHPCPLIDSCDATPPVCYDEEKHPCAKIKINCHGCNKEIYIFPTQEPYCFDCYYKKEATK